MNKVCISILNRLPENTFKIEAFWFASKSFFLYRIFNNFQKKIGGGVGVKQKRAKH